VCRVPVLEESLKEQRQKPMRYKKNYNDHKNEISGNKNLLRHLKTPGTGSIISRERLCFPVYRKRPGSGNAMMDDARCYKPDLFTVYYQNAFAFY
jgi:hypothetical protein